MELHFGGERLLKAAGKDFSFKGLFTGVYFAVMTFVQSLTLKAYFHMQC